MIINPFESFPASGGGGATPTIIQHKNAIGQSVDPTITLGAAPTAGNRIFACYMPSGAFANPNSGPTGWTLIAKDSPSTPHSIWLYRDVLSGDSATLPVFESPHQTTTDCGAIAWEIAGSNPTFASAVDLTHFDNYTTAASPLAFATGVATGHANELALAAAGGEWFFGTAPTLSSPYTQDESVAGFSKVMGGGHQAISTSGASAAGSFVTGTGWSGYYALGLILLRG